MAVTETWLHSHKDAELNIDGYQLFRCDRKRKRKGNKGRYSGGVAVYARDSLAYHLEVKLKYSNGAVEVLGLYSARENLFLVVLYRQPDDSTGGNCSSINEFKPALDKIQAEIAEIGEPSPNILICGDFNLPGISWDNVARRAGSDSIASSLIDFMEKHFLNQHILQSTHKDGNSLDLVFTNNANLLHSYECIIPTLSSVSDHYIVECKTTLGTSPDDFDSEQPIKSSPLDNLNFFSNDINWEHISDLFKEIDWTLILSGLTPEKQLAIVLDKICLICRENIPLRKSNRTCKPKIPRDRRILMRKRKKISDQLKLNVSNGRRMKLQRKLVDIEISLQNSHLNSKALSELKAIEAIKKNPKYFFSYTKKHSSLRSRVGPLLDETNMYTGSSKKMADILSNQYKTMFSEPRCKSVYTDKMSSVNCSLSDILFTVEDVVAAIDELSNNSGSGPDGVPAILLKKCRDQLSYPLFLLWRNCVDVGMTPGDLKMPISFLYLKVVIKA